MDNKEFTIKGKLVSKRDSSSFDLVFRTVPELFSYKHVDEGTMLLLGELEVKETDDCLDMGCGYGVIGISMAKLAPKGRALPCGQGLHCRGLCKHQHTRERS